MNVPRPHLVAIVLGAPPASGADVSHPAAILVVTTVRPGDAMARYRLDGGR
jgi:hypothetical protein